ncbi:nesprin-2-like isoform X2 [Hyperolius riggenbachi]
MEQDRQLCAQFLDSLSRFEDWLQITQIATSLPNPSHTLHREATLAMRRYEGLLKEMRQKLLDLESLNRQYWRIAQMPHTLLPTALRSRMQEANHLWDSLQNEAENLHLAYKTKIQQREEFDTDQDDVRLCLTEMDLELSSVEYIYSGNSSEKIQQLKALQEDVRNNTKRVEDFLDRGDQLMYDCDPQDAEVLEEELTELGSYCHEIITRLSRLQKRLVSTKLVFEDDVLDSGFEHVSSGSSDVFLDLDFEEDDAPCPPVVPCAKAMLPIDLEWDPTGDVGSSGSHDGRDSSYLLTDASRNKIRGIRRSESGLSSDSGVTNSKNRSQEDLLRVEEDFLDYGIPGDNVITEGTRAPENEAQLHTGDTLSLWSVQPRVEAGVFNLSSPCEASPVNPLTSARRRPDPLQVQVYGWTMPPQGPSVASNSDGAGEIRQCNNAGQRRRQGKKKRMPQALPAKKKPLPARRDVSILMDSGDDVTYLKSEKSPCGQQASLRFRRCLAPLTVILLLLCGLFFVLPVGRPSCSWQRFSWHLMLTYVNGPPPT